MLSLGKVRKIVPGSPKKHTFQAYASNIGKTEERLSMVQARGNQDFADIQHPL